MQKWEYLLVFRRRGLLGVEKDQSVHRPQDWINDVWSSKGEEEWKGDRFFDLLNRLGDQGWELVSVSTLSDWAGGVNSIAGAMSSFGGTGVGQTQGITVDLAGFSTAEKWVFKRPKG